MPITKGNWSVGIPGTVISDTVPEDYKPGSGHDDMEYYGGFLICESVKNDDAKLIAAAPGMLDALKRARRQMLKNGINSDNADQYNIIDAAIKKATE